MKISANKAFGLTCSVAAAVVIAGAASLVISQPAAATPEFAAQTKKACVECHTNPKGAGPLTAFGQAFKANGNKLPT